MKNHRYYLLDIARGIAAFSIVIFHYKLFYYPARNAVLYVGADNVYVMRVK